MITSCEQWTALVEQVARMPEVIATTLREHAPTREGRCATCHVGNIATAQAQLSLPALEPGRCRP